MECGCKNVNDPPVSFDAAQELLTSASNRFGGAKCVGRLAVIVLLSIINPRPGRGTLRGRILVPQRHAR